MSDGELLEEGPMLAFGEAVGWRAWTVKGSPKFPRLFSENGAANNQSHLIWPTKKWMVARCPSAPEDEVDAAIYYAMHHTPDADCSCGIYAARTREHLLDLTAQGVAYQAYTRDKLAVIGRVGLAGKVIEHVNGFKAAKARVIELFVPAGQWQYAAGLGAAYGCPVVLDNTWAEVVSGFATSIGKE